MLATCSLAGVSYCNTSHQGGVEGGQLVSNNNAEVRWSRGPKGGQQFCKSRAIKEDNAPDQPSFQSTSPIFQNASSHYASPAIAHGSILMCPEETSTERVGPIQVTSPSSISEAYLTFAQRKGSDAFFGRASPEDSWSSENQYTQWYERSSGHKVAANPRLQDRQSGYWFIMAEQVERYSWALFESQRCFSLELPV
jgi:hypothetical protein